MPRKSHTRRKLRHRPVRNHFESGNQSHNVRKSRYRPLRNYFGPGILLHSNSFGRVSNLDQNGFEYRDNYNGVTASVLGTLDKGKSFGSSSRAGGSGIDGTVVGRDRSGPSHITLRISDDDGYGHSGLDALDRSSSWGGDALVGKDEDCASLTTTAGQQTPLLHRDARYRRNLFAKENELDNDNSVVESWDSSFDDITMVESEHSAHTQNTPESRTPSPTSDVCAQHRKTKTEKNLWVKEWVSRQGWYQIECNDNRRACGEVEASFHGGSRLKSRSRSSSFTTDRGTDKYFIFSRKSSISVDSSVNCFSSERDYEVEEKMYDNASNKIRLGGSDDKTEGKFEQEVELPAENDYENLRQRPASVILDDIYYQTFEGRADSKQQQRSFRYHRPRIRSHRYCRPSPRTVRKSNLARISKGKGGGKREEGGRDSKVRSEDDVEGQISYRRVDHSNLARPTIPTSRKRAISPNPDCQHHQKKHKLDHLMTVVNEQFQSSLEPKVAFQISLPIRQNDRTETRQKSSTSTLQPNIQEWRPYSPGRFPNDCYTSKLPSNGNTVLVLDPTDPGPISPSPLVTGISRVWENPLRLEGGKGVENETPNPFCQFNNRFHQQIPVEAEKAPGIPSSQFIYDPVRDIYIGKALLEGQDKKVAKGFPKFPELPSEIRMRIFKHAGVAWGPNNVFISCRWRERSENATSPWQLAGHPTGSASGRQIPDDWSYELRARYKLPPLLCTNYEARVVAQKLYKLSFAYQLSHSRGVWFDFARDKLIMESGGAFDLFKHGVEDTEEDRSEQKKVEKALRYLGIRALLPAEIVALCDYSQGLQNLNSLYLERTPVFYLGLPSYEEYFFMRIERELRGRWERSVGRQEIGKVPVVHTLRPGNFEKRLGFGESEDPDEHRFTSMEIQMGRRISKLKQLAWMQSQIDWHVQ